MSGSVDTVSRAEVNEVGRLVLSGLAMLKARVSGMERC